ncbi:MAG: phospho-sugar mutase [Gracilibacteraceae bacterium]|jgi:phosphoglucomutase|nr:phospho-sugar mutase [Gracilibacteraceae bacterium]
MTLSERTEANLRFWTEDPYFSPETRTELLNITDPRETEDRLARDLEFGTGGMRGKLGAGTNRMNIYVVRKLTQGLADAVLAEGGSAAAQRGVVIAYDSRRFSPEFARETALVLGTNGIRAFLFTGLRPTPELSFAVRHLGAAAGVMVTASHNPKEYNGYKVYWADGAQLAPDKAAAIAAAIEARADWRVPVRTEAELRATGLYADAGEEIDAVYLAAVRAQLLHPALTAERGGEVGIVFTPLHGAGAAPVRSILAQTGFTRVFTVPEQEEPDGDFPTVLVPNPEDGAAFALAARYGDEQGADLLLATDPDSDRLGICSRNPDGSWRRFTGNQTGVLLEYYILSSRRAAGTLPADGRVIKSIVSTALAEIIADSFAVTCTEVPVGFKFIGEQIHQMEQTGQGTFVFGFEESLGYLTGTYARDKDAVLAAALAAEAALYFRTRSGQNLTDVLEEIYKKWGYFLDDQEAYSFTDFDGGAKMEAIMRALRGDTRPALGGLTVASREDFAVAESRSADGGVRRLDFPHTNLLRFTLAGGGFVMARPSGTEPKIRFYFCVAGANRPEAEANLAAVRADFFRPYAAMLV